MAARAKAWVCGRSLAVILVSNPAGGMHVCCVVCCQAEVSVTGRSLAQGSPTDCDVSDCDRESSIMRPWPIRGCRATGKKIKKTSRESVVSVMTSLRAG